MPMADLVCTLLSQKGVAMHFAELVYRCFLVRCCQGQQTGMESFCIGGEMMGGIRLEELWDPQLWCDVLGRGVRDVVLSLAQWCC